MSLFTTALSTALALILVGVVLIWNAPPVGAIARAFPRSRRAAILTMGLGTAWTLYHVLHLGESDFGNYRHIIFVAFALLALASFKYVPDFLAVRGACILALFTANELLGSSWMNYDAPPHKLLNGFAYVVLIGLPLWLAVSPFRVRDFFQWLFARPKRARLVGAVVAAYGLVLLGAALSM
jgi:hypothetical protein